MKRILSGVQPTGDLHLGNYLGAIKQFVAMQDQAESFFCVVDLHAITVKHDPKFLARHTREIAAAYLACGVDTTRDGAAAVIFAQSHVPAHSELAWLMNCVARMGWLERMTQFREKTNSVPPDGLRDALANIRTVLRHPVSSGPNPSEVLVHTDDLQILYDMLASAASNKEKASVGLFTYPVLMAADILAYRATHVPVGDDQKQHLNLARDIAQKFNNDYPSLVQFGDPRYDPHAHPQKGGYFPIPDAIHSDQGAARIMSLQDGTKKMSKSDPDPASRINLSDSNDVISKKIRRATAYTLPFPGSDEELVAIEPDLNCASVANLINIYIAVTGETREAVYERFGGQGYGVFKPALADAVVAVVEPIRTAMNNLLADESHIRAILRGGADYANDVASKTVDQVKDLMGFERL